MVCQKPINLQVSNITTNSAHITWESENNNFEWSTDNSTWNNITGTSIDLLNLNEETEYTFYIKSICDEDVESNTSQISFTTLKPREQCQIGDNWGNSTSYYLPSYSYYNYSLTQQIYTSDEIGNAEHGQAVSISFYNSGSEKTRNIDVYIENTDKENFSGVYDWVPVTSNKLYYSGSVTFTANDWTTINLTWPFEYEGGNILLTIDDNTGSWTSSYMKCKVYDAPNQALYIYSDGTNYDPTAPSQYFGNIMNVKNQIKLCTKEGWTLPISLLSFTASPQPEYNLIQWSTATEKNNDLFILERSEDAIVFDEVYNVNGAGSSLEPIDYEFRDYCPVPDITYYRLTQVDYDGSKTTSEMVSCIRTFEKKSNWEYFTKYDNLLQVHSNDKVLTIICSDLLGRTIWQGKLLPHDDTELNLQTPYMVHIYEDNVLVGSEKVIW